jgi:hypothetical protein
MGGGNDRVLTITVACLATARLMTPRCGNPHSYIEGLHHALIASAVIAAAGAVATAWLLLPVGSRGQSEAVTETA